MRAFGACPVALLFAPRQGGGSPPRSPPINIPEHTPGDTERLEYLARNEPKAKQRDRLRAVLLAIAGEPTLQIARTFGCSRRVVQNWSYAYRDGGIEALTPTKQPGRNPKLDDADVERFKQRLDAGPLPEDKTCTLRGSNIQKILQDEFDAELSLGGVYATLHRLRYSCLKPRPQHRKSNPEAQARWVAGAPFLSIASGSDTPPNASSFSSKTSAASANKGG